MHQAFSLKKKKKCLPFILLLIFVQVYHHQQNLKSSLLLSVIQYNSSYMSVRLIHHIFISFGKIVIFYMHSSSSNLPSSYSSLFLIHFIFISLRNFIVQLIRHLQIRFNVQVIFIAFFCAVTVGCMDSCSLSG